MRAVGRRMGGVLPPDHSRRVVVLHGYQASPGAHWFGWLADDLRADGVLSLIHI